jgi:putative endonuclease
MNFFAEGCSCIPEPTRLCHGEPLVNLYTGITNSIYRRALQHKYGDIDGFTKRYNINRLVYYVTFTQVGNAIAREKQIKSWTRAKKLL